jgi:hypothetical protein
VLAVRRAAWVLRRRPLSPLLPVVGHVIGVELVAPAAVPAEHQGSIAPIYPGDRPAQRSRHLGDQVFPHPHRCQGMDPPRTPTPAPTREPWTAAAPRVHPLTQTLNPEPVEADPGKGGSAVHREVTHHAPRP